MEETKIETEELIYESGGQETKKETKTKKMEETNIETQEFMYESGGKETKRETKA